MADGDGDSDGGEGVGGGHGDPNVGEAESMGVYAPMRIGPAIPHYYGDYVRQIFMGSGALMLVLAPFLASTFPAILPFEIGGAIIVVILGAMTNPQNSLSILANAIAAGVAVVTYELLALSLYFNEQYLAFIEREALAIAFLVALYFSLKTFRNMVHGRIGKRNTVGEFMKGNGD
jgi:hypothetical protein